MIQLWQKCAVYCLYTYMDECWCPFYNLGAIKIFETFTIHRSHRGLSMYKVSGRNSKINFPHVPEGGHNFLLKTTVKIQYLGSNKLSAWILFRVFIAHWDLHYTYTLLTQKRLNSWKRFLLSR